MTETPYSTHVAGSASGSTDTTQRQAWIIVLIAALVGLGLAIVWSFEVADHVLGANIANTIVGADAKELVLDSSSLLSGVIFSIAAGLAATFTACNCVVFSCIAPLTAGKSTMSLWRTLGWMTLGILLITGSYGIIGTLLGEKLPILNNATLPIGKGYPIRLAQSSFIFVGLGVIFVWWGLHTLQILPNPLAKLFARNPWFKPFGLGLLIGCFTIGRPFGLFRKAFSNAIVAGDPFFGGLAIALQGLSNILIMVLVLLGLIYATGGRFERWLSANPSRITRFTAISVIVGGIFFIAYWGLRVPSYYEIGWFPHMSYR
ncbi:MAG TPA: hypothetical protein DEF47_17775 [Herpetosiphon sp.]|uniref:Uncharacterized protein n=1 Tax=Herpetosiphon aurantiacus (strain ATCC 23779 / DSM 785 / 114-95) TaxID=316274 RepID=A9AYE6_HERA2|nr:hypothetical protein [Herpetosiphon sp.]ABX03528.1 hypothetical protein Haur_0880 [Herpetosiphon aurantiacus DSM 785]HBW51745.1 hypothetical protein [Herpetosiphon sp.]